MVTIPIVGISDRLSVENSDDTSGLSFPQVAAATNISNSIHAEHIEDMKELSLRGTDPPLYVFCFFEDIHRMGEALRQVWTDSASCKIPLVVATAVTQSVITMIRRTERDFTERPQLFEDLGTYISFVAANDPWVPPGNCARKGNVGPIQLRRE